VGRNRPPIPGGETTAVDSPPISDHCHDPQNMTGQDGTARSQPASLATSEYEIWREFIWRQSGLYFSENRREFLVRRIQERMRACQVNSCSEYYHFVRFNRQGDREWQELLELLTVSETRFFRHEPSFRALAEILPDLLLRKQKRGINTLRMWSAGCSTGQEAYALAMVFLEAAHSPELWRAETIATDISRRAMAKARNGLYEPFEVRHMPEYYRTKYLTVETATARPIPSSRDPTRYRMAERVREMVRFGYLNLSDLSSYWIAAQDVIFCQNVLIYFKPESKLEIARHLCQQLVPGGYLFLAPVEALGKRLPGVDSLDLPDALVYKRVR